MIFKPDQRFCVLDYETFSEADLKKVGSYEYSVHESTEILVASWMSGTMEELKRKLKKNVKAKSWAPKRRWNSKIKELRNSEELVSDLKDPNVVIVAHNAMFEQAITRNVLWKHLGKKMGLKGPWVVPHSRFFCTAVQSAVHAMPRSLDGVTGALKTGHVKDKEGHRLMLKWSKPKKPSKADPSTRYTKGFKRLAEYCEHDIYAEVAVFTTLPMLQDMNRRLWLFDQEINFRGAKVDRKLVKIILKHIAEEKKNLVARLQEITKGKVTSGGQTAVIKEWLRRKHKIKLDNLQAKTVEDAINNPDIPDEAKEVLRIRSSLNKTSLKKYTAFLNHTTSDGYMRFSLNFNATVHGRWGGAGVQPHNFPRGTLKYKHKWIENGEDREEERDLAPYAADLIKSGVSLEFIRSQFGDPIEVFVSCLRCMIIAEDDEELYVSDFSAIEARVLFWLADHADGVHAFKTKRQLYEELARVIFKIKPGGKVTKEQRFVGKQAFLLSGYGGGWKKFQSTCAQFNQPVSTKTSKDAINGYRKLHSPVVKLWSNLEQAAINAVENPRKTYKINHTEWFMDGKFLCCRLPSGRKLFYNRPEIKYKRTPWGATRPTLYHWTVDSKTKRWVFVGTWGGVLTQNCVGGISRDLLAASMVRVEKANYPVILSVHDEVISKRKKNTGGSIEEFNSLMKKIPKWGRGIPMGVEGFAGPRYRK